MPLSWQVVDIRDMEDGTDLIPKLGIRLKLLRPVLGVDQQLTAIRSHPIFLDN